MNVAQVFRKDNPKTHRVLAIKNIPNRLHQALRIEAARRDASVNEYVLSLLAGAVHVEDALVPKGSNK